MHELDDPRLVVTFPVELPASTTPEEIEQWLSASGYTRVQAERLVQKHGFNRARQKRPKARRKPRQRSRSIESVKLLDVVADRFRIGTAEQVRVMEAIEAGLKRGGGKLMVYVLGEEGRPNAGRKVGQPLGGPRTSRSGERGGKCRARHLEIFDRAALP